MYALIYIAILGTTVTADNMGVYPSMSACFEAREDVLVEARAWDGYLEAGKQAVCVVVPE